MVPPSVRAGVDGSQKGILRNHSGSAQADVIVHPVKDCRPARLNRPNLAVERISAIIRRRCWGLGNGAHVELSSVARLNILHLLTYDGADAFALDGAELVPAPGLQQARMAAGRHFTIVHFHPRHEDALGSVGLWPRELDNLAPFLGFLCDQLCEIIW
jgi:hypothetical protein